MSIAQTFKIYFNMLLHYKPKTFWNDLLSNSFDLRGVGHYRLSNEENLKMYEEKKKILAEEIRKTGTEFSTMTEVVEIGCGVGYWTDWIHAFGVKKFTGNDIAEISARKLAERYPEYLFLHGDISEVPLPKNRFDRGVMIDVTQHITDDKRFNAAMKNLWDSLKPGATLFITMWDPAKNVYLANKIRLNRIEKPRGLSAYLGIFGAGANVLSNVDFNDKFLLTIRKS